MSTGDHIEFQAQINKRPNPYIDRIERKRLPWKKIGIWTLIIFCILLVVLEITIFRNKRFFARLVVFTGNVHLSDQILAQEINAETKGSRFLGLIPKKNMLFFPKSAIQNDLNVRFGVTNVNIETVLGKQTIHVTLTEAPVMYHLQRNDELLNVTRDGHIIASGVKVSQNTTPVTKFGDLTLSFTDQTPQVLSLVQLPKSLMDSLKAIDSAAQQIQSTIIITTVKTANEKSTDVQCQTAKGWYIRIDTTENISTQIQNAQKVFLDKIQNTSKETTLQYIDARILDRVYYK